MVPGRPRPGPPPRVLIRREEAMAAWSRARGRARGWAGVFALLASVLGLIWVSAARAAEPQRGDHPRVDALIAQMTLDEKIDMLHGATDPASLGQAGYVGGVPRLGIPPLRLADGPAGVRV